MFFQLAVSHGFGGVDSEAKADWMVLAVDQWFSENVKEIVSYFPANNRLTIVFSIMKEDI